jgi:hypothetical protein
VIREQTDRRFFGTMSFSEGDEQVTKSFVGIFVDKEHFMWSEPNGIVDGRAVGSDTIESCYVRVSAYSQNAACQTLTREK